MIELERTFLIRYLPEGIGACRKMVVKDVYFPKDAFHPVLRLRMDGSRFMLTKKTPVKEGDSSVQREQTIELTKSEFDALSKLEGKVLEKVRYFYDYRDRTAEIDVFKGALECLVLVDFEFGSKEEKDAFKMPGFCLVDVTQEDFIAGGLLAGKKYEDIKASLEHLEYKKIVGKTD